MTNCSSLLKRVRLGRPLPPLPPVTLGKWAPCPPQPWRPQIPTLLERRVPCEPCPPATRSFQPFQYPYALPRCLLIDRSCAKALNFPSLFSSGCALFHFPYPVSPVFAASMRNAPLSIFSYKHVFLFCAHDCLGGGSPSRRFLFFPPPLSPPC